MDPGRNHFLSRILRLAAAAGAVACLVLVVWVAGQRHVAPRSRKPSTTQEPNVAAARNTAPQVRYVGDAACQGCHPRLTASYHQHPMGQSLRLASFSGPPEAAAKSQAAFDVNGLHFQVERRGGRMVHEASCRSADGRVLVRAEAEIRFAVGAGKRGYSYLQEQDGYVYQSPISWYAEPAHWGLSPHLTNAGGSLERPVSVLCLFCHANHVQLEGGAANHYRQPVFDGMSIGCERCHGPGELHVRQAQAGTLATTDDTIVNPAKLPPALRDAVCQQCHLKGVARVLRRGRQPFDFRPGLPLSDFWAVFVQPLDATGASKFSSHVEQMNSSRCFQGSRGQLGCISCHDPHELPPAATKTSYYRSRCLACHGENSCHLSLAQRRKARPDDSCTACHMPRRPNSNIAHMVSTDHRILRRPGTARPGSSAQKQLPPDGINLLLFQEGPGQPAAKEFARDRGVALMDLAALPQAEGSRRRLAAAAWQWLEPAVNHAPDDVPAQQALGYALWLMGRPQEAWATFNAALAREPEREETLMFAAGLREQMGSPDEALELWQRVKQVNPRSGRAAVEMARLHVQRRDWPRARAACDAALRLDPFRDQARQLRIVCELRTGQREQARAQFEELLQIRPAQEKTLRAWFKSQQDAGQ